MNRSGRQAYEAFVRDYAGRLHAFAAAYLQDGAEAEDVVQTAFLKAWERWDALEADRGAAGWVYAVVRNEAIERLRFRRKVHDHGDRLAAHRAATAPDDPGAARIEDEDRGRRLERVRRIVAELREPYRSVILLRFAQHLSYADIAATLQQPLGTVKTHLCRALRLVRRACSGLELEVEDHDELR
jgi:RNA polymerase sigma-70 factor (ECF subfamily)